VIVIDTSAIVAILRSEPEGPEFLELISAADHVVMSAVTMQECGMVLRGRFGAGGIEELAKFVDALDIEVVPHSLEGARQALAAFERYGKGVSSVARLNFCDCAAYALAQSLNAPLLFKGDDFSATDVIACR
jgi:ribonuclease VapC